MNKTHTHLDDLFADARREAVPEITKEQVTALATHADSLQSRSLFSRKGITIMTSITILSTAALVAYLGFGAGGDTPTPPQHERMLSVTTPATPAPVTDTLAKAPTRLESTIRVVRISTDEPKPVDIKPEPSLLAPAMINGVTPLPLAESRFTQFGLVKIKDKGLAYFVKEGKGHYTQFIIPNQGWGVLIDATSDKPAPGAIVLDPVIVTDGRGNKRMINYSDPNHSIRMTRNNDDSKDNKTHTLNQSMSIGIQDSTADPEKLADSFMIYSQNDSAARLANTQLHKALMQVQEELKAKDPNDKATRMKMVKVIVNSDGRDSIGQMKERELIENVERQLPAFTIDSVARKSHQPLVKREIRLNINSLQHQVADSSGVRFPNGDMVTIDFGDQMREMEAKLFAKLSTLVPILVRPGTVVTHNDQDGIDYDNGVIMWCEPSAELSTALASTTDNGENGGANIARLSVSPTTDGSGAMQHATIFPNPAQTTASVRFTLSEPRIVAFSVHNILGQKLLDGGEVAFGAGEQTRSINIGTLSDGMYLLAITTDHGEQVIQRIVVRK